LPDPVGAAMRVWRPALIAGHASACAGVGEAKLSANQFATAGWNWVSTSADARDAAALSLAPVRVFEIEAKSECKLLAPTGRRGIPSSLYMAPDHDLVTLAPLRPGAAIADRGWRGPKDVHEDARLPTGYGPRLQGLACRKRRPGPGLTPAPARFKRLAACRQFAPPNWESIYDQ
jgi:hypothetical protein